MFNTSNYAFNQFAFAVMLILIFNSGFLVISWENLRKLTYRYFFIYLFSIFVYSLGYFMQSMSQTIELKEFWATVKIMPACFIFLIMMQFAYALTSGKRLPLKVRLFLFFLGLTNAVVAVTNNYHHLFRYSTELYNLTDDIVIMDSQGGYWFFTVYLWSVYLPLLMASVMFISAFVKSGKTTRMQFAIHTLASLLTIFGSSVQLTGAATKIDSYAFTTIFVNLLHYIAIFKFPNMNTVPLAKDILLNILDYRVYIFSREMALLEVNTAAQNYLELNKNSITMDSLCKQYGLDIDQPDIFNKTHTVADGNKYYSVHISLITEGDNENLGYLFCIKDITCEHSLMKQEADRENIRHKKLLINDIHDGLSSSLTLIRLLSGISHNDAESMAKDIHNISEISEEVVKEFRLIMDSYDRNNISLDNFVGDIRNIGNMYTSGTKMSFSLTEELGDFGDREIPFEIYVNVIRLLRECAVNSIKYSNGSEIKASLAVDGRSLYIEFRDNGIGFQHDQISSMGRGMNSIADRIERLSGKIELCNDGGAVVRTELDLELK